MPSERRLEKLSDLMEEELSSIISREVELPEGILVTITRVVISPDGHYAAIFISVLGGEAKSALEILQKRVYNIQQRLNRRLRVRPIPKIHFAPDLGEMHREKIEKTLAELKRSEEV